MKDNWDLVLVVVIVVWLLSILSFSIYFWVKVMPVIKKIREQPDGNVQLTKVLFPPRFHK